jgi:hypothetical protein
LAYNLRIFELPLLVDAQQVKNQNVDYFIHIFNMFYLTIVTLTTVGFGDFTPKTYGGKVIIIIASLWGAFMISLLVLSVSSTFDLKENQLNALRHIKVTKSAARTISASFRFYRAKKEYFKLRLLIDPEISLHSVFLKRNTALQSDVNMA